MVSSFNVQHNHSFQVGDQDLYVSNRRLTEDQEIEVYNMMSTFRNSRQLRVYTYLRYNRRLRYSDLVSIKLRHSGSDRRTDCVKVRNLLRGKGICIMIFRDGVIRFVFFVPSITKKLVTTYGDVILADATHQSNCVVTYYGTP